MNKILIKPPHLQSGDTIGVVAPAGLFKKELLENGLDKWRRFGMKIKLGSSIFNEHRYLAGTNKERTDDFNRMFNDPEIKAIICVRGGAGSMQLVEGIDWSAARSRPRILMGFSDVTFLLQAWIKETGQVAIHGPMAANPSFISYPERFDNFLLDLLQKPDPNLEISPEFLLAVDPACPKPTAHRPGKAQGRLNGGCLSLLINTLGTPWEIDTTGSVLFIEDTNEPPYRIERMLWHLKLAGKLENICAICFGNLGLAFQQIAEGVEELLGDRQIPILYNLPVGHGRFNLPLPLGIMVEVDSAKRRIKFLEGAVG